MVVFSNSWDEILKEEFKKEYYIQLRQRLKSEYSNFVIYPSMFEIFSAFKKTSYDDVKVVIIGQDPYHNAGQAHGLSFSVKQGIEPPPSLINIFKELQAELGCYIPDNGCLDKWAEQGVLLLNSVLTVRANAAASHKDIGWQTFTDNVIELLNKKTKPIVYFLWGRFARSKAPLISKNHLILEAAHPSPLSAYNGFFGCRHFQRANQFFESQGLAPIDWQIENIN